MKIQILCFFLILFASCNKEHFSINNLNDNNITKLGHGGMGVASLYPMNSIESILKCIHSGMDGFEIDIQMTADNHLIAFHDATLDKTTNISGIVNSLTLEEIKKATYKNKPLSRYPVASLHDIFSAIKHPQQYTFVFDCKLYTEEAHTQEYYLYFTNAIIDIAEKFQIEQNILTESNNKEFLLMMKEKKPEMKLFIYPENFEKGLSIAEELGLYGITIASRNITKEQIQLAHSKNIRVAIWNIHNRKQTKEAILKNPDYIQTDDIASLRKLL